MSGFDQTLALCRGRLIEVSDGNDPLERALKTRYGQSGLLLFMFGGLLFAGALGGLIVAEWEGSLGYTIGFVGMCIGFVGGVILALAGSRIDKSSD
jgi:hypothetical protein